MPSFATLLVFLWDQVVYIVYWFQLVFTAFKGFKIIYRHLLRVLSCNTPFQALTPKSQKEQNKNNINWDTFTFYKLTPPIHLGQKLEHGQARPSPGSQVIENRLLVWKQKSQKVNPKPNTPPTPYRLLLPGCWPPHRPPAGLQVGKGWGDVHPRTV